ncbi:MAG: hypothetical protein JSR63_00760 [Proteobacteria bacterium]|nr:hypothetical protein [Pseudomonadota bacterium]MBS0216690.1 hypothetical protein [Pseudomonadota bacterium]
MNWDAFQREALVELGIELYALGGGDDVVVASPVASAPAVSRTRAETGDVLLRHLLKAAGGEAHEQDVLALAEPLSGLRGNPAAKRALWPLLRRLRRS